MHLYFYARGKFEQLKLWESLAQNSFWKWRRKNLETGEIETSLVQGALRPSILGAYEFVFPRTALTEVCAFFGIKDNLSYGFGKYGLSLRHGFLRKLFGAKKIPKKVLEDAQKIPNVFSTEEFERGVGNCIIPGIPLHIIGIKEDVDGVMGKYEQEML